jgi:hypothetical protein
MYNDHVKISGSIRKWHYGATSLKDLSKMDTWLVICKIAQSLGITNNDMLDFTISELEIGFNIQIEENVVNILNQFSIYKDTRYERNPYKSSLYFETKNEILKLYDKIADIKRIVKKEKIRPTDEEKLKLEMYGKLNVLRVEIKYKGGAAKIFDKIRVHNLRDLVLDYYKILRYYWCNVQKVSFYPNKQIPEFNVLNGSQKDLMNYLLFCGYIYVGMENVQRLMKGLKVNTRSQTKNTLNKRIKPLMNDKVVNYKKMFTQRIRREIILALYHDKKIKSWREVLQ